MCPIREFSFSKASAGLNFYQSSEVFLDGNSIHPLDFHNSSVVCKLDRFYSVFLLFNKCPNLFPKRKTLQTKCLASCFLGSNVMLLDVKCFLLDWGVILILPDLSYLLPIPYFFRPMLSWFFGMWHIKFFHSSALYGHHIIKIWEGILTCKVEHYNMSNSIFFYFVLQDKIFLFWDISRFILFTSRNSRSTTNVSAFVTNPVQASRIRSVYILSLATAVNKQTGMWP